MAVYMKMQSRQTAPRSMHTICAVKKASDFFSCFQVLYISSNKQNIRINNQKALRCSKNQTHKLKIIYLFENDKKAAS
jgi:hypothetical protein